MTDVSKVAGVGCGYFSRFHYDAWKRLPVDLVAVCDQDTHKAREFANKYQIDNYYQGLSAMLHEQQPDVLDIILPPDQHLACIRLALKHDTKYLICQKPFMLDVAQAKIAIEMVKTNDALLVIHENFRFQPWYEQIKKVLNERLLGDVYQISFRLRPGDGQGPSAYLDRQPYFQKMPRFLICETAIHFVDVFRYLLGEPKRVFADLRKLNPVIAGEDAGHFIFEYDNGQRAIFDGNRLSDHVAANRRLTMGEMLVEGSTASLRLNGDGRLLIRPFGQNDEDELEYKWNNLGFGGDCVFRLQQHVLNHIRGNTPIANDVKSYLANLEIVDAIYESNSEQRWTSLQR